MSPDKLFDYLDGKLSADQREQLEEQLLRDAQLQQQFAIARKIHERMSGNIREVVVDQPPPGADRARRMMRRITAIFLALIFINTVAGVIAIAVVESKRRHSKPAAQNNRQEVELALKKAAADALPNPTLVEEIKVPAPSAQTDAVIASIDAAARLAGGSAAKNLSNETGTLVFAEIPPNRLGQFQEALSRLGAAVPPVTIPTTPARNVILQIRIVPRPE